MNGSSGYAVFNHRSSARVVIVAMLGSWYGGKMDMLIQHYPLSDGRVGQKFRALI